MDWEPQLAPPIDRPPIEEYPVRYPWGTGLIAATLLIIFLAVNQMTSPSCAQAVYPGTCFARGLMETRPIFAVVAFPLLHGNGGHLLSNLLSLVVLGLLFEQRHSSLKFIGFVAMAGYLSVYADIAVGVAVGEPTIAIGASGATRALGGFLLVHYATVNPLNLVKAESAINGWRGLLSGMGRVTALILAITLLFSSVLEYIGIIETLPEIALFAHLVGTTVGILAGLVFKLGK